MQKRELTEREYIWSFIDSFLVTFLLLTITQIIFAPYGTNDYSKGEFYLCIGFGLAVATMLHWASIKYVLNFLFGREEQAES